MHSYEVFPGTFHALDGVSKLTEGGEAGVLEEAGCSPDQRDQKLQSNSSDVSDVEVVRIMYPPTLGERKRARKIEEAAHSWTGWDKLPALASDDDEHDTETLGVAGGKKSRDETRVVVRPTMYLASLDIKTAFDEAKPKHVAKIMDNHNTHRWIIAALLREMSGTVRKGHV